MPKILPIRIGHLSIVDHLILGIAAADCGDSLGNPRKNAVFSPVPLAEWEPMCQDLRTGKLDAAMISLPLAMDLFSKGADISLVMLGHRGGSILAARPEMTRLSDFKGKSLLIPHKISIQHLLMHKLMAAQGIVLHHSAGAPPDTVCAEAVPMALMPEMARNDRSCDIAGFISPDPFATQAALSGGMKPLLSTQALWKDHPCCGLVVTGGLAAQPERLSDLMGCLFSAAAFLDKELSGGNGPKPETVSRAAAFFNQPPACASQALTRSGVTFCPDLLIPEKKPLDIVQDYLVNTMGLMQTRADLNRFVNPAFALTALSELNR